MNKIKLYVAALAAGVIAILMAIIRSKNGKLAVLGDAAAIAKHTAAIADAEARLDAAEEKHDLAVSKFRTWEKDYARKYPKFGSSDGNPPDGAA